ncbi:gas vesicle protein GvpG [Streptacidiphilus monticola]
MLDKVVQQAEREYYDPEPVQARLADLERARDEGRIEADEFDRQEEELLARLEEIRLYQLRQGGMQGGL